MATAQDLIDGALRLIGVLASGETPTATERSDGLVTLNRLLASWNAQAVPIPYLTADSFTLTGVGSILIGTGQTFDTARPLAIRSASITASGVNQGLRLITAEEWLAIEDFTLASKFAEVLYYEVKSPEVGRIGLWPTPESGGTLGLYSYKPLAAFATLATTVSLPEGYERALRAQLALELAPEYGAPVSEALVQAAADAKTSIFGLNVAVLGAPKPVEAPVAVTPSE